MKNVILFGYGKMGSSIARGWMLKKLNFKFFVIERDLSLRNAALEDGFEAFKDIEQISKKLNVNDFDVIFLAVKPQQMANVVKSFYLLDHTKILFISIAAGLSFSWFKSNINKDLKIVRAMPNLPVSVGRGVTGYCVTDNLSIDEEQNTTMLLNSFGKALYLKSEKLIDVVTAISGSGPAYIFYLIEVLSEIGENEGLLEKDSKMLALETLIGSARLLESTNIDPKVLRQNVTSPGGTTEAGLEVLASEQFGLYNLFKATISSAKQRAIDLNSKN